MTHVDVIKNEWLAGYQIVVARLSVDEGEVRVDVSEPRWRDVVLQPWHDPESGRDIDPANPEEFVQRLHEVMKGDYLYASEPHEERDCPYASMVVPLEALPTPDAVREPQPA